MVKFYLLTTDLTYLMLAIATIVGIKKYKFLRGFEKCYLFYLIFICFIEIASNVLVKVIKHEDTSDLYVIYIIGSFTLFSLLYTWKLKLPDYTRWILVSLAGIYGILQFIFKINADFIKAYSTIVLICLIGATLLVKIKNNTPEYRFLFTDSCLFLYNIVSVFLFIILNQIQMAMGTFSYIWSINNMLTTIVYFSFLKNFLQLKK